MGWAFASGCRLGCFCPVFEEENCNILCTLEFLSLRPCLWLLQSSSIGRHEDSGGRRGRLELGTAPECSVAAAYKSARAITRVPTVFLCQVH